MMKKILVCIIAFSLDFFFGESFGFGLAMFIFAEMFLEEFIDNIYNPVENYLEDNQIELPENEVIITYIKNIALGVVEVLLKLLKSVITYSWAFIKWLITLIRDLM